MKVKLTRGVKYPAPWAFGAPSYPKGAIVRVIPANNQPNYQNEGKVFIDTPELKDDCYGILLDKSDYEIVPQ